MSDVEEGSPRGFTENGFWQKLARYAKIAGKEVVQKALWLFYASQHADTPGWAKAVIYGALAYFILPVDAIPDFIPVGGYVDDLGVLSAAVLTVLFFINSDVKEQARKKMSDWFGEGLDTA